MSIIFSNQLIKKQKKRTADSVRLRLNADSRFSEKIQELKFDKHAKCVILKFG